MLIHHHIVIRAEIGSPPTDELMVESWLRNLIQNINMNILYGPKAIYSHKVDNRGMTAFAIIDTSHICLHTWDETSPGLLQLDVYSCAEFNINSVVDSIKVFDPVHIDYKVLDRTDQYISIA